MSRNPTSQIATFPMDLASRQGHAAEAPLEQFIRARWLVTAALLRRELERRDDVPCDELHSSSGEDE